MPGLIAKRYRIESLLEHGRSVYQAVDVQLARTVALKMIPAERSSEAEVFERFFDEATAAARLSHPNVVRIYDVADHTGRPIAKAAGRDPVIVMEYVPGRNLDHFIGRGELLPSEESTDPLARKIDLVLKVCRGLRYGHEQGLVHGTLNPSNIRVTPGGDVKILNFGITPVTGQPPSHYMSPEQCQGSSTDLRSDIFSLGRVLFELLVLDLPHEEQPDTFRAIEARFPGSASALIAVLRQSLAKDPANRFSDSREMERALKEARNPRPVHPTGILTPMVPVVEGTHPDPDPPRRQAESLLREALEAQAGGQPAVASLLALQALQIDPTLAEAERVFKQTQQMLEGKRTGKTPEDEESRVDADGSDTVAPQTSNPFPPGNVIPPIPGFEPAPRADTKRFLPEPEPARPGAGPLRSLFGSRFLRLVIPLLAVVLLVAGTWLATNQKDRGPAPVAAGETKPAPKPQPASESGTVALDIVPWSRVESIVRVKDGWTIELGELVTPCVFSLPAGRYMVIVSHPDFGSHQFPIEVKAGEIQRVEQTLLSKQDLERELNLTR